MARADNPVGLGPVVAIGAGLGAAWLVMRGRGERSQPPVAAVDPVAETARPPAQPNVVASVAAGAAVELPPGRWVWPLPRWRGRAPEISSPWGTDRDGGTRKHKGTDLMYPRRALGELAAEFPAASPHSLRFFVPENTVALAAADGTIWSAGYTPHGWSVVLSHGAPWATYYTHLSSLFLPETARGAGGYRVTAGQPIGIVGVDPPNPKIRHLHFEIWKGGDHRAAINPEPILRRLPVVDLVLPSTIRMFS